MADGIGAARVLAIVTARPDFVPPWFARPHASLLTLGRLGRAECAQPVATVAAAHGLPAETVAAIVAKTDGVPLFVEELTKSMIEASEEDGAAVPATLTDSLMARLDRLGDAREVAQIAAVIGRQFPFALLDAVAPRQGAELDAALAQLVAAGIVFPEGLGLERSFSFKHALVCDAAYESLLLARRRDLHQRLAQALEERFPETAASEPELLARHFGQAGVAAKACDYRERAGDHSAARSSYQEAIAHYSAGLEEAGRLREESERQRRQLAFLLKLGPAFKIVSGAPSAQVEEIYQRAAHLGDALEDAPGIYRAKWGLWLNAATRRKTAAARDKADELVALAQRSGDGDLLLEAYHCRRSTAFFRGEIAAAREFSRIGADPYEIDKHRHLGPDFGGHDPGVCARLIVDFTTVLTGEQEAGQYCGEQGIALAEALDHPFSLAHALFNAAVFQQTIGDREKTGEIAERTIAICDKYGFPPYRVGMRLVLAWARGVANPGCAELVEQEIAQAAPVSTLFQHLLGVGGAMMLAAGEYERAIALFDRALDAYQEPDVGYYLPEIWRLRGQCLLALDRANKVEAREAFATARRIARRQGAALFEHRAEASLSTVANT